MAMIYNTIPAFVSGNILTAAQMNAIGANVNNYRVTPMCVLVSTGVQILPTGVPTALTYGAGSENVDTDAMHSIAVNTDRITVVTAGVYAITWHVDLAGSGAAGSRILIVLIKNDTQIMRTDGGNYAASSSMAYSGAATTPCDVGDYLYIAVLQISGGNRTVDTSSFAATWQGQVS